VRSGASWLDQEGQTNLRICPQSGVTSMSQPSSKSGFLPGPCLGRLVCSLPREMGVFRYLHM